MISRLILLIIGLVVWALISWSLNWQHLLLGLAASAFVSLITGDLFVRRPNHFGSPKRYFAFLLYLPVFAWECIKSNIDVALRVLSPKLDIKPGIVKIDTKLTSDTGLTFLANSITLKPGTFCIDINQKEGVLYVHWIDVKTQKKEEAAKLISSKFEKLLRRIFE